jgi:hypothetical protein
VIAASGAFVKAITVIDRRWKLKEAAK